jgi:hypothetical protein
MAAAGKAGTFSTWMLEESDLIQHAAKSVQPIDFILDIKAPT